MGPGGGSAPQGGGHSPELPEFKEHWDSAFRHWVWVVLSGGMELDLRILEDPFPVRVFYGSVVFVFKLGSLFLKKETVSCTSDLLPLRTSVGFLFLT